MIESSLAIEKFSQQMRRRNKEFLTSIRLRRIKCASIAYGMAQPFGFIVRENQESKYRRQKQLFVR
jgi:hypothetical protein